MKISFLTLFILLLTGCIHKTGDTIELSKSSSKLQQNNLFEIPKGYVVDKVINEDFDNNLVNDHIYLAFSEEFGELREFWVNDQGELLLTLEDLPSQNHHYFIDLDNDNKKEVIIIRGYEDGSDAQVARINFKQNTLETLFYFNPVVLENGRYYWGYAWDINHLIINPEKQIFSSFRYIERDDEYNMVDEQTRMPILIFSPNKNFKPFIEQSIPDAQFRSLNDIINFSINE